MIIREIQNSLVSNQVVCRSSLGHPDQILDKHESQVTLHHADKLQSQQVDNVESMGVSTGNFNKICRCPLNDLSWLLHHNYQMVA